MKIIKASDFTKPNNYGGSSLEQGIRQHAEQDEAFAQQIGGEWNLTNFIKSQVRIVARPETNGITFSTPINDEVLLVGRMDELISDVSGVYCVEDKPSAFPAETYRNQLLCYCLLIKRNYRTQLAAGGKGVYGLLKKTDTQEIFWRIRFDQYWEQGIVKKILELTKKGLKAGGSNSIGGLT
jgi:hypothetical protein